MIALNQLITKIESNPSFVFDVFNVATGERLLSNQSIWEHEDKASFFNNLLAVYPGIQVQLKEKKGASTKNPQATILLKKEEAIPVHNPQTSNNYAPQIFGNPSAGLNGLNAAMLTDMVDARALRDKVEFLAESNITLKKLVDNYESELRTKREAFSSLKVSFDTLEQRKDLEKERELLNQKGTLGQLAEKIDLNKVTPLLTALINKQQQGAVMQTEGLAAPEIPENKQELVKIVLSKRITQTEVNVLKMVAENMVQQPGFTTALLEIITNKQVDVEDSELLEEDED